MKQKASGIFVGFFHKLTGYCWHWLNPLHWSAVGKYAAFFPAVPLLSVQ